jgi:hypothetical protein
MILMPRYDDLDGWAKALGAHDDGDAVGYLRALLARLTAVQNDLEREAAALETAAPGRTFESLCHAALFIDSARADLRWVQHAFERHERGEQ